MERRRVVAFARPVNAAVVEEHAEEVAFLWERRARAVHHPNYTPRDLARLEARLEANLDGLRVAGGAGWEVAEAALERGGPGEVFAAACLALEGGETRRIRQTFDAVRSAPEALPGLVSALGWVGWEQARGPAAELVRSAEPVLAAAGIRGFAVSRQYPGPALEIALRARDPLVVSAAVRAAGELGRSELMPELRWHAVHSGGDVRGWAAWSGALLGNSDAAEALAVTAEVNGPRSDAMAATAARSMASECRNAWLGSLRRIGRTRLAAVVVGATGDPGDVPWLLEVMGEPRTARAAGEAFTSITGADLALLDLEGSEPEGFEEGPTDDPSDEDVAIPSDSALPWPEPDAVARWWRAHAGEFAAGRRCLAGAPISREGLHRALREGKQRQRLAAAEELKILTRAGPLFECRSKASPSRSPAP